MTDFRMPQRMSVSAFFVIFCKNIYKMASIFIVLFLMRTFDSDDGVSGEGFWFKILIAIGVCLAIVLLTSLSSYLTRKFYVENGNLIFTHGLLRRETSTIPLDKIHTLRTHKGLIYQMFSMRGISFDTLASKGEDIELILDESDWQSLMNLIEAEETIKDLDNNSPNDEHDNIDTNADEKKFRYFGNKNLFLDALCQNHLKGAAVLGGFLAAVYDRLNDFSEDAAERIINYTENFIDTVTIPTVIIIAGLIAVYILILVLWLGKVMIRYYDMTLETTRKLLTFSYGLISRMSCRFSFNKICTIWVKQNFLEKRFGLATIMLRQALFASAEKEEDNLKLYGKDDSDFYLKWWLGENYGHQEELITAKSGKGLAFHIITRAFIVFAIATVVLVYFHQDIWLIIPTVYLIIMIFQAIFAMRRNQITIYKNYIRIDNGRFADNRNYLKYENIEVIRIIRTPLTPYFNRVTLAISTPGTSFKIRSLKESEALKISKILI